MRSLRTALLAVVMVATSGCFGSFPIVKKVYGFNSSIGNGILRQVVFWAFNIVPVYGVAGFLDVVIFNLLEFWTGSGAGGEVGEVKVDQLPDGSTVEMTRLSDDTVRVRHLSEGQVLKEMEVARVGERAAMVSESGRLVVQSEMGEDGAIRVADEAGGEHIVAGAQLARH